MLRLELIKETRTEVVYNYFPEQENEYGTVTIGKSSGEVIDAKISSNDTHHRYLHHAVSRIGGYIEDGIYMQNEVVAWH